MFKITKDGTTLTMTEAPTYVRHHENGCFVLCLPEEAEGVAYGGTVYHLAGRPGLTGLETVILEAADAGAEIVAAQTMANANVEDTSQAVAAAKVYAKTTTTIPDASALQMKDLFPTWEEVLKAGEHMAGGAVINDGGTLYRVVGSNGVDPLESQPPHGEGMLAVYRPIDQTHAGTLEDPIPWVYGMDSNEGSYYSYEGVTYLCKLTMPACVYAPGTAGLWQWEAVE